jgi:hypothetical protein
VNCCLKSRQYFPIQSQLMCQLAKESGRERVYNALRGKVCEGKCVGRSQLSPGEMARWNNGRRSCDRRGYRAAITVQAASILSINEASSCEKTPPQPWDDYSAKSRDRRIPQAGAPGICNCLPYLLLVGLSPAVRRRKLGCPWRIVQRIVRHVSSRADLGSSACQCLPVPAAGTPWKGRAAVNKPTIAILSILAIALLIIAFVGFGPAFATQLRACQSSGSSTNLAQCLTSGSSATTIGLVLYLAGVLAALLAWIMGLLKTAQIRRWAWFVVVLLISPLGSLLYGVVGPTTRTHA